MNNKKVLIIEDSEAQRLALHEALEMRGFHVESAREVATARSLIGELLGELDVVILDMRLEDANFPDITGADLGLEALKAQPVWPPEFIIHSGYSEVSYYELALRLRVAAYLQKQTYKQNQIIQHVRALALRRALNIERPDAAAQIKRIVEASRNPSEAILKFCREILIPEFNSCLGAPFILLLTDQERTISCGGNSGLPEGESPAYSTIQAMAYAESGRMGPFVFDSSQTPLPDPAPETGIFNALNGAAFISLSISRELPLTLGILKSDLNHNPLAEDASEIAMALIHYFKPAVLEQLLKLSSFWAGSNAHRAARLHATSQFCLYVGQEQLSILQDVRDSGEWSPDNAHFQTLQAFAVDLRDTGQILSSVESEIPIKAPNEIEMPWYVRSVWDDLDGGIHQDAIKITGNCTVQAAPEDLFIIISRLLQWFTQRFVESPSESGPEISVHCTMTEEGAELILEDRSRRLGKQLRRRLFDPFTQAVPVSPGASLTLPGLYLPLYLAKVLIEEKYKGKLEECSDEIKDTRGHRFLVRFPPPQSFKVPGDE